MSTNMTDYRRGVVRPVECLQEGWNMIRERYWLFFGITLVGILVASAVPLAILVGPMMCGIYLCLLTRRQGAPVTFEMLFKGFDYFVESLIAALIQFVPVLVLMIPFYVILFAGMISMEATARRGGGPPVGFFMLMGGATLGMVVVATLVSALFIFTFPLIVDRRLSGLEAVKTSVRAVFGNLGGVIGLLLLNMLCGIVGVLLCYVGVFFFLPVGLAGWAVAYDRIFGMRSELV